MKKFFNFILIVLAFSTLINISAFAIENNYNEIIIDNGSDEWIMVNHADGIYAIRFISESSLNKPRLTAKSLYRGNRSLTTNYSTICTRPSRNYAVNIQNVIEVWNGGDDEGNGAVTFKIGNTEVSVNAQSGAQVWIDSNSKYTISAKANWYNGLYYIEIADYC